VKLILFIPGNMSNSALKPYLLKVGSLKNSAEFVAFISSLLNDPEVYVFGEIVENDKIKSLSQADDNSKKSYALLQLFAYGKFSDFKAKEKEFPSLSQHQVSKLRQLTILALANKTRTIAYKDLMSELGLSSVREVENEVITTIYHGIIHAKLNSEKQQLLVEDHLGRDVKPQDIDTMINTLTQWQSQSTLVLSNLEKTSGLR